MNNDYKHHMLDDARRPHFDDIECVVLLNGEDQRAILPRLDRVPDGWSVVHGPATRAACRDFVEASWVDMRPRSLRESGSIEDRNPDVVMDLTSRPSLASRLCCEEVDAEWIPVTSPPNLNAEIETGAIAIRLQHDAGIARALLQLQEDQGPLTLRGVFELDNAAMQCELTLFEGTTKGRARVRSISIGTHCS